MPVRHLALHFLIFLWRCHFTDSLHSPTIRNSPFFARVGRAWTSESGRDQRSAQMYPERPSPSEKCAFACRFLIVAGSMWPEAVGAWPNPTSCGLPAASQRNCRIVNSFGLMRRYSIFCDPHRFGTGSYRLFYQWLL